MQDMKDNKQELKEDDNYIITVLYPNGLHMKVKIIDNIYILSNRMMQYKGIDASNIHQFLDSELNTIIRVNPRLTIDFIKVFD